MSVPLDRLYQFIESVALQATNERTVIYRFTPHGSKKLQDLRELHGEWPMEDYDRLPVMYCHDQEPLMWNWYQQQDPELNLRRKSRRQIYDQCMLLHSEQRSSNVVIYQRHGFVPVYYWSHAVIARDWFRYAQHVAQRKHIEKCFLMYNRAWSGSREYRLKLLDMIIDHGLTDQFQTTVNAIEPELGVHYSNYSFVDPRFKPQHVLEEYFLPTQAPSHSSADFHLPDYEHTQIEVVLETLFDDDRIQLTEKILRPIACGQPFILAATAGSLDYLRSYGFQTFDRLWNEDYDTITDPLQRLTAIVAQLNSIANWTPGQRQVNQHVLQQITEHNKKLFFSVGFEDHLIRELSSNIKAAHRELLSTNTGQRLARYVNTI
jgi:hypothetical protein